MDGHIFSPVFHLLAGPPPARCIPTRNLSAGQYDHLPGRAGEALRAGLVAGRDPGSSGRWCGAGEVNRCSAGLLREAAGESAGMNAELLARAGPPPLDEVPIAARRARVSFNERLTGMRAPRDARKPL